MSKLEASHLLWDLEMALKQSHSEEAFRKGDLSSDQFVPTNVTPRELETLLHLARLGFAQEYERQPQ